MSVSHPSLADARRALADGDLATCGQMVMALRSHAPEAPNVRQLVGLLALETVESELDAADFEAMMEAVGPPSPGPPRDVALRLARLRAACHAPSVRRGPLADALPGAIRDIEPSAAYASDMASTCCIILFAAHHEALPSKKKSKSKAADFRKQVRDAIGERVAAWSAAVPASQSLRVAAHAHALYDAAHQRRAVRDDAMGEAIAAAVEGIEDDELRLALVWQALRQWPSEEALQHVEGLRAHLGGDWLHLLTLSCIDRAAQEQLTVGGFEALGRLWALAGRVDPHDPNLQINIGLSATLLSDESSAQAAFRRAIDLLLLDWLVGPQPREAVASLHAYHHVMARELGGRLEKRIMRPNESLDPDEVEAWARLVVLELALAGALAQGIYEKTQSAAARALAGLLRRPPSEWRADALDPAVRATIARPIDPDRTPTAYLALELPLDATSEAIDERAHTLREGLQGELMRARLQGDAAAIAQIEARLEHVAGAWRKLSDPALKAALDRHLPSAAAHSFNEARIRLVHFALGSSSRLLGAEGEPAHARVLGALCEMAQLVPIDALSPYLDAGTPGNADMLAETVRALARRVEDLEPLRGVADLFHGDRWSELGPLVKQRLETFPEHPQLWLIEAQCLARDGDMTGAARAADRAVTHARDEEERGGCAQLVQQLRLARTQVNLSRAMEHMKQQQWMAALELLEPEIAADPNAAVPGFLAAQCLLGLRRVVEAITLFERIRPHADPELLGNIDELLTMAKGM